MYNDNLNQTVLTNWYLLINGQIKLLVPKRGKRELNKLIFSQSFAFSYFSHLHTVCFELLEQNGGKRGKLSVALDSRSQNTFT